MRRGEAAERAAEAYLAARGLILLARNYRSPHGEIDLIMQDGQTVVFVEVRQRRNPRYGSGADSVDARKQRRLQLTAEHYLQRLGNLPACRFDVVSLDGAGGIDWIAGAFEAG
mgnify:FL=1